MTDCFRGFPPSEMTLLMGAYFLDLSIGTEEMGGKSNGRIGKRKSGGVGFIFYTFYVGFREWMWTTNRLTHTHNRITRNRED